MNIQVFCDVTLFVNVSSHFRTAMP